MTSVTHDPTAFSQLAAEWDDLLARSASRAYFLRHHWVSAWWQHYAPPAARLHILTCRTAAGRLVAVAPLYRIERGILGLSSIRELLFLGTGVATKTSEYLDVIVERGLESIANRALAESLRSHPDWDRLWLHQLPHASPNLTHLAALFPDAVVQECDRAPFIHTADGWEAFKRSLGRSMRRNVEYYPRRLQRTHTVVLSRAETPAAIDEGLDALVRLHQESWQRRGEPGAFACHSLEPFLRQAAHHGIADGQTRLWTLRIDDRIEAALIGFLDNGVLHYFQKGFNLDFADDELGNVMVALCVRACCEDPAIRIFDFMGGGAPYKQLWGRQSIESRTMTVHRRNHRTALYETRDRVRARTIDFLRWITPMSLRAARRAYLKRRRLRE